MISDSTGSTDIITHMMPFESYTTESTCGPSKRVCKSFQFRDLHSFSYTGIAMTPGNMKRRTLQLVDQYKKKATLYKTNNVLVPLGTDFAWKDDEEWKIMTKNFDRLMKHVNSEKKLHTEVRNTYRKYLKIFKGAGDDIVFG